MNATVVGADRLGNIPELLAQRGIRLHCHISGRAATDQRQSSGLPRGTQLLILFTDFLGHNVMRSFRKAAVSQGIPVVACRRSASALAKLLENHPSDATRLVS